MSARGSSAIPVNVNPTGRTSVPRGTGTTVVGVVAGGAMIDTGGDCKPQPGPEYFAIAKRTTARDTSIVLEAR